jgi:hypothetical protein
METKSGEGMEKVFLLWHVVELDGADDEKLIGVYRAEPDAKTAIERLSDKPGFADFGDGFQICPYELNRDHWTEGFVRSAV